MVKKVAMRQIRYVGHQAIVTLTLKIVDSSEDALCKAVECGLVMFNNLIVFAG